MHFRCQILFKITFSSTFIAKFHIRALSKVFLLTKLLKGAFAYVVDSIKMLKTPCISSKLLSHFRWDAGNFQHIYWVNHVCKRAFEHFFFNKNTPAKARIWLLAIKVDEKVIFNKMWHLKCIRAYADQKMWEFWSFLS